MLENYAFEILLAQCHSFRRSAWFLLAKLDMYRLGWNLHCSRQAVYTMNNGHARLDATYIILVVDGPCMSTIWAFVKDSLSFIDGSHLHSIKANFWMTTLDALFFDGGSCGFLRSLKESLFLITLGPEGNWSIGRACCRRRQLRYTA
jgi:hypothetical protein